MKPTRAEQETIIRFDEETDERGLKAEIYTYNSRLKRRLSKLCEERPDECKQTEDDGYGGLTFECPKVWIKINPSLILTEEQKQQRAAIAKARFGHKSKALS